MSHLESIRVTSVFLLSKILSFTDKNSGSDQSIVPSASCDQINQGTFIILMSSETCTVQYFIRFCEVFHRQCKGGFASCQHPQFSYGVLKWLLLDVHKSNGSYQLCVIRHSQRWPGGTVQLQKQSLVMPFECIHTIHFSWLSSEALSHFGFAFLLLLSCFYSFPAQHFHKVAVLQN